MNDNPKNPNKDRIDIKNFPNSKSLTTVEVTNNRTENNVTETASENETIKPSFLGKIYKELCVIEKSKSMSNADKDNIKDELTNLLDFKKPESKSASSVKKLLETQNIEDFKKWSLNFVAEDVTSDHMPTTSTV